MALRAFLAATRAWAAEIAFLTTRLASVGVLLEPVAETFVGGLLDERAHRDVAELGLRLTLELRVAQLHRDDRRDALADVLAEEVVVLLLEQRLGPGVLVDHRRERRLEPLDVHPALGGGDAVGVAVDALVVPGVPLHGDVEHLAVVVDVLEVADLGEQRLLGGVEVLDEVDDAAAVLVGDLLLLLRTFVDEQDLQAAVEERHRLQPLEHRAGDELGALGDEHGRVRPERDRGSGLATAGRCRADDFELALWLAALGVLLTVVLAVAVDLEQESLGQGVDDADADAVQAAGHLVAVATELAAGVQHGEHDLGRALALVAPRRVRVDGDAAPVVLDSAAAVGAAT